MPLSRSQKEKIVSEVTDILRGMPMVVFADFKGMSVVKTQGFRRNVRNAGGKYRVAKKTLVRIAFKTLGLPEEGLENYKETLAVAVHTQADGTLPKLFKVAAKDAPELKIVGGILESKHLTAKAVLELADLPSKEDLLARLAATLASPLTGFARVLNAPLSGFVNIINKLATK